MSDKPSRWSDIDGAVEHLNRKFSKKQIYNLVKAGLKVSRPNGEGTRPIVFNLDWIDEFFESHSSQANRSTVDQQPASLRIVSNK